MATLDKEKVLSRVQKLLNLAEGNANENESQNAMLQAQKLLASHNLTISDVDASSSDKTSKEVVEVDGTSYTKLQWWAKKLAHIISDNFRCYHYMSCLRGKRKVVFLGTKEDVEIAKEVYQFAIEDIKYQSSRYLRKRGASRSRAVANAIKNDYINGYLVGLKAKFDEQVQTEGWGLILVKDDAVVDRYEGMQLSNDRPRSRTTMNDSDAFSKGREDGRSFNPDRKGIE